MNVQHNFSQNERDELNTLNLSQCQSTRIDGRDLVWALLICIIFFCIFTPKIYVSGQIYYLSRDISKISSHLELLQEENKNLKQELEDFKFQQLLRMGS